MSKQIGIRLDKSRQEKLAFLYKLLEFKSTTDSGPIIELIDKIYSEKNEQPESEEIVETLPSCPLIPTLITSGKHKNLVFCPNPKVVGLRKGNHVPLGVCLNCWIRQENIREHKGIPTSETTLAPEWNIEETEPKKPTPKPQSKPVQKQEPSSVEGVDYRKCLNPDCDKNCYKGSVKKYPNWIPKLCSECFWWSENDKIRGGKGEKLRAILDGTIELNTQSKEE